MYNNDDITLEQVRIVLEQLARETQRKVEDVTIRDTIEVLKRGSNGTVGAYVKQVKMEHLLAERYDMRGIAPQLKAAIVTEIDRFVKNSEEVSGKLIETLERDHSEICKDNDKLHQEITRINKAFEEIKAETIAHDNKLTGELATERQMAEGLRNEKDKLDGEVDRLRNELSEASVKTEDQAKQLGNMESSLKTETKRNDTLQEESAKDKQKCDEAEKKSVLAEQKAEHREETIKRLDLHNKELDTTIEKQANKIEDLDAQLRDLNNKLFEAIKTQQDEDKKNQKSKRSKRLVKKDQANKQPSSDTDL